VNSFKRSSHCVAAATMLLLTMLAWHAEAIATQLTLTWVNNAVDAAGFSVERSTGGTGAFAEIATTGVEVTTYVDPTVADATSYCYRVRAFTPTIYSDYSTTACGIPARTAGLAVVKMGPGSGTVVSAPTPGGAVSDVICGMNCSGIFASGITVILTATPATGSSFAGWSGGGCTGTGSCKLTLTSTMIVTAAFNKSSP
jgi:List-Bact-rpt repeat protein